MLISCLMASNTTSGLTRRRSKQLLPMTKSPEWCVCGCGCGCGCGCMRIRRNKPIRSHLISSHPVKLTDLSHAQLGKRTNEIPWAIVQIVQNARTKRNCDKLRSLLLWRRGDSDNDTDRASDDGSDEYKKSKSPSALLRIRLISLLCVPEPRTHLLIESKPASSKPRHAPQKRKEEFASLQRRKQSSRLS